MNKRQVGHIVRVSFDFTQDKLRRELKYTKTSRFIPHFAGFSRRIKSIIFPNFLFICLLCLFFFSRLVNLSKLPLFNDEAMYLNWGRLVVKDPQNLFISLTDGQQPFFIWLTSLSYGLGKNHWLLAGRMISVFSGLGTMLVLFYLGKEVFNQRIGWLMAFLYVVVPFTLWYDRLAIKDSFLSLLATLILYLAWRQTKTRSWREAILSGVVLGVALLTKSIAYFFVGLYLLTVIVATLNLKSGKKKLTGQLIKVVVCLSLAWLIQAVMYVSPLSRNIGPKNDVFLLSPAEIGHGPISLWRNNLYSTIIWWWQYYQLPILFLSLIGLFLLWRSRRIALILILLSWITLPIGFEILTAKIYIPRYFLFTFTPFCLIVAYGWQEILIKLKTKLLAILFIIMTILPSLYLDGQLLFSPLTARLPQIERWQYVDGWPAGYGLKSLVTFLKENYLDKGKDLLIITEKETLISSGLSLYLADNDAHFEIERIFALGLPLPADLPTVAQNGREVVIILHHNQEIPVSWPVKEVTRIPRLNDNSFFLVYQLN